VHHAIIVPVGPDCSGETAYGSPDDRTLKDADAGKDGTGSRADSRSARRAGRRTGEDAVRRRIISARRAGIILAVIGVAVDIDVIVGVGPHRTGEDTAR